MKVERRGAIHLLGRLLWAGESADTDAGDCGRRAGGKESVTALSADR